MPIGKNSIKRVANSGYSNIDSKAPDMENSVINEPPKKTEPKSPSQKNKSNSTAKSQKPKSASSTKKPTQKTNENKADVAMTKEKATAVTEKIKEKKTDSAVRLGDDMPTYLL